MARKTAFQTKSQAGNLVLGILLAGCAVLLIGTPCLALGATALGQATPPKGGREWLGVLFVFGVLVLLATALLGLAALCMHTTLFPRTLSLADDSLVLLWGKKRLGQVPFANIEDVIVKTRAMAGDTAEKAYWQSWWAGGALAGMAARARFNPDESVGFIIRLTSGNDPGTFWPKGFFRPNKKTRLDVHYFWELPHGELVERIMKEVKRYRRGGAVSQG